VTTSLTPRFVLSGDELHVLGALAGIEALPVVLGLRARHSTQSAQAVAADRAARALQARGVITDDEVSGDLVALLRALQRPDRELALRLASPAGLVRATVVRRGACCVSARRVGDEIAIDSVDGPADLTAACRALLTDLPAAPAAPIVPVSAPLDAASETLSGTHDPTALCDGVRALGADPAAAMALGSALASRVAFAEIVYYTLDVDADRISRFPAAVGVFYTKRGRIVAAPSASPSGQLWTTLKPGSDHAIKQAVGQLVEMSTDRWEDF
jgi:hypothetical protein